MSDGTRGGNEKTALLDQARSCRSEADRARRLARSIDARDVVATLRSYAEERDVRAGELEEKARHL
jgi:hypothetical protein